MAVIDPELGIPFRGKVGGYVGYMWKQKHCIRTYRREVNYPNTEAQQCQRSWFVSMVRFASCATEALRLGLRRLADEAQMTEGNYFVRLNKSHFARKGNTVEVNYEKLVLADGSAADVYFRNPMFGVDEIVEIGFEKSLSFGRSSGDDRVYAYFYSPALGEGYLAEPAERRSKRIKVCLPEHWAGQEVHIYGFVVDHNGRASRSTYIGRGRVSDSEERGQYMSTDSNWQEFVDLANSTQVPHAVSSADTIAGSSEDTDTVLPEHVPR